MKENKGIIKRFNLPHYPDGKKVSPKLPEAYQLGNDAQNCGNCVFLSSGKCNYWKAKVRNEYWCKSWKAGVSINGVNYNMSEQKIKIMSSLRKRIKPESFSKQRPVKNIRKNRVRNRLIKQSGTRQLTPTNDINTSPVSKMKRKTVEKINKTSSIGSLKRSRRRK